MGTIRKSKLTNNKLLYCNRHLEDNYLDRGYFVFDAIPITENSLQHNIYFNSVLRIFQSKCSHFKSVLNN